MKLLFVTVLISNVYIGFGLFNAGIAKENEFPYMVRLQGRFLCGGALISERFVLTAAHCLMEYDGLIKVTLGSNDAWDGNRLENGTVKFRDKMRTWIHENFTMPSAMFDIAIIELPRAVNFSKVIQPIKISNDSEADADNAKVTISGWGKSNGYSYPFTLKTANLNLISLLECKKYQPYYIETITNDHICANGTDSKRKIISPCDGDSGSPLVLTSTNELIGITSYVADAEAGISISYNDCQSVAPSVYTRVSSYLKWIENKTGIKL